MSKHGFTIKPKNKKLLKSSKIRKYFSYLEDIIAEELKTEEVKEEIVFKIFMGEPIGEI